MLHYGWQRCEKRNKDSSQKAKHKSLLNFQKVGKSLLANESIRSNELAIGSGMILC